VNGVLPIHKIVQWIVRAYNLPLNGHSVLNLHVTVESCVKACAQIRAATMSSDTQSPHTSSPVKDSARSVRVHSSSPVISGATASETLPDASKSQTRSVAAILRDTSTLLDRNACIIAPFDDEVRRDAEFFQS